MKQTYTIRLTPATHAAIKNIALSQWKSLSELIEEQLKTLITDDVSEPKTRDEIIDEVVKSLPDATDDEPAIDGGAPVYADEPKTEPDEEESKPYELGEPETTQFY